MTQKPRRGLIWRRSQLAPSTHSPKPGLQGSDEAPSETESAMGEEALADCPREEYDHESLMELQALIN